VIAHQIGKIFCRALIECNFATAASPQRRVSTFEDSKTSKQWILGTHITSSRIIIEKLLQLSCIFL